MSGRSLEAADGGTAGSSIEAIEGALTVLVRRVDLPQTHEQLLRAAGIPLERAADLTLRQVAMPARCV